MADHLRSERIRTAAESRSPTTSTSTSCTSARPTTYTPRRPNEPRRPESTLSARKPERRRDCGRPGKAVSRDDPWDIGWWRYRVPGLGDVDRRAVIDTLSESGYVGVARDALRPLIVH